MSADYYETLARTGPMKIRATSMLALGDKESLYEASVLLHEVVREERRAFLALADQTPAETLAVAVEGAWLLFDALDPVNAGMEHLRAEALAATLAPQVADRVLARLRPRAAREQETFLKFARRNPLIASPGSVPAEPAFAEQLEDALRMYPGAPTFWFWKSVLAERVDDFRTTLTLVRRAYRLAPDSPIYFGAMLRASGWAASSDELDEFMPRARERLETLPPIFRVLWWLAELESLDRRGREDARRRASAVEEEARAVEESRPQHHNAPVRRVTRAVRELARLLHLGLRPTVEVVRGAGLGEWVAKARPKDQESPVRILSNAAWDLALAA